MTPLSSRLEPLIPSSTSNGNSSESHKQMVGYPQPVGGGEMLKEWEDETRKLVQQVAIESKAPFKLEESEENFDGIFSDDESWLQEVIHSPGDIGDELSSPFKLYQTFILPNPSLLDPWKPVWTPFFKRLIKEVLKKGKEAEEASKQVWQHFTPVMKLEPAFFNFVLQMEETSVLEEMLKKMVKDAEVPVENIRDTCFELSQRGEETFYRMIHKMGAVLEPLCGENWKKILLNGASNYWPAFDPVNTMMLSKKLGNDLREFKVGRIALLKPKALEALIHCLKKPVLAKLQEEHNFFAICFDELQKPKCSKNWATLMYEMAAYVITLPITTTDEKKRIVNKTIQGLRHAEILKNNPKECFDRISILSQKALVLKLEISPILLEESELMILCGEMQKLDLSNTEQALIFARWLRLMTKSIRIICQSAKVQLAIHELWVNKIVGEDVPNYVTKDVLNFLNAKLDVTTGLLAAKEKGQLPPLSDERKKITLERISILLHPSKALSMETYLMVVDMLYFYGFEAKEDSLRDAQISTLFRCFSKHPHLKVNQKTSEAKTHLFERLYAFLQAEEDHKFNDSRVKQPVEKDLIAITRRVTFLTICNYLSKVQVTYASQVLEIQTIRAKFFTCLGDHLHDLYNFFGGDFEDIVNPQFKKLSENNPYEALTFLTKVVDMAVKSEGDVAVKMHQCALVWLKIAIDCLCGLKRGIWFAKNWYLELVTLQVPLIKKFANSFKETYYDLALRFLINSVPILKTSFGRREALKDSLKVLKESCGFDENSDEYKALYLCFDSDSALDLSPKQLESALKDILKIANEVPNVIFKFRCLATLMEVLKLKKNSDYVGCLLQIIYACHVDSITVPDPHASGNSQRQNDDIYLHDRVFEVIEDLKGLDPENYKELICKLLKQTHLTIQELTTEIEKYPEAIFVVKRHQCHLFALCFEILSKNYSEIGLIESLGSLESLIDEMDKLKIRPDTKPPSHYFMLIEQINTSVLTGKMTDEMQEIVKRVQGKIQSLNIPKAGLQIGMKV